ncbi:MAG: CBS domain-containing protein [Vicinamibacterales bacterium]
MSKCSDVMTREPVCCEPGDSVTQVAGLMKREDIGSVPVVESREDRKLVGIVTDRDLVVKVLASGNSIDAATVRDAMTSDPASCRESDDVSKAVELMSERKVRRMPIVDGSGRLAGIISQADVATRVHSDQKTGALVEAISEPGLARK